VILGLPGLYAAPPLRFFRERLFGRLFAHNRRLHSFRRRGLLGHSFCRGFLLVARMRFGVDGLITFAAVALATSLAAAALLRRASFARLIGGREFADIRFGGLCHIAVRLIAGGVVVRDALRGFSLGRGFRFFGVVVTGLRSNRFLIAVTSATATPAAPTLALALTLLAIKVMRFGLILLDVLLFDLCIRLFGLDIGLWPAFDETFRLLGECTAGDGVVLGSK